MSPPLSHETQRRLDLLFKPPDRAEAACLLVRQCGNNLPFSGDADEYQLERVRFAALRISRGKLPDLRTAVEAAEKLDFREVLLYAAFADDIHAHKDWLPGGREDNEQAVKRAIIDWNARLADLRADRSRRRFNLLISFTVGGIVALAILAALIRLLTSVSN